MSPSDLSRVLAILRASGVVGMPTETVYGLAADARSSDAVAKIFALKGRPSTNPLIVHVASVDIGERYAVFDDRARKLFETFAPGALTVVLNKRVEGGGIKDERTSSLIPHPSALPSSPHPNPLPGGEGTGSAFPIHSAIGNRQLEISPLVSAGLDTVGIRVPNHPVALELLRYFDGPLAAPSANKSNHVSPTTARHVRDEFGPELLVLDGGPCRVGIESTVLDLSRPSPTILRPGDITKEQIEAVIGPVNLFEGHVDSHSAAMSPGQHRVHYAPRAKAYRVDSVSAVLPWVHRYARVGLMTLDGAANPPAGWVVRHLGDSPGEVASRFYASLREIDATQPELILIEMPPDRPEWAALRDRITRATARVEELTAAPRRTT